MGRKLIIYILVFLTTPALVLADPPAELGEVRVIAPAESTAAPSAFHTVIRPADQAQRFTTAAELLAETVGAHVRSLGGPGQFSTVAIRGSSAEQVAVYLDGVRINAGGATAVDLATLPTAGVDRIEVIRGGGGAQFGGEAIGGVINIVTKRAAHDRAMEISGTGGSFLTFKTAASLAMKLADRQLLVAHSHWQSSGDYSFRQAGTTLAGTSIGGGGVFRRDHNRSFGDDLLLKYETPTDAKTRFNVTNDFFWTDRQLPGTEAEATLLAPTNPLEATQRIFRNLTHAGLTFTDLWTPRLQLAMGLHNTFSTARFQDASPAIGQAIDRTTFTNAINPYFRWEYDWPTAMGTHLLTTRYDYWRDLYDDRAGNATTTLTGLQERDTHQILLQDEWRLLGDRLTLLPVARYADASDFSDTVAAKFGVAARPVGPITVKANIERTHRFPNFTELYYPDEGYLRGNPALAKESALVWAAGAAAAWRWGRLEAAYFQHLIDNSILFVPVSATTIQPINTFAARAEGVEIGAEATPLSFFRVSGNYTWLMARFADNSAQLPGRPRHTVNARMELFREFSQRIGGRCFVETQFVSRLPVNVANSVFLAARTTLDVGLTATLATRRAARYFVTIEAKDVTNVQVYDARGFPLPRRSFYLTIGAKWS
ncbi:MAG: TonB-dependent receptor [Deltaproteobacteria bacterium]|nr:TonB-dependent receptor [Deltaproteobacteria bacterium]